MNSSDGAIFIVYTNSAICCDLSEWTSTKTVIQKISNGNPVGSPTTVIENGSIHDGISPNGHYTVTGQSKLKMKHLVSGEGLRVILKINH